MDMSLWPLFGPPCTCNLLSWEWGEGTPLPQPTRWSEVRRKLPQRDPGQSPGGRKTILLLSKRVRTPLVATFVEN